MNTRGRGTELHTLNAEPERIIRNSRSARNRHRHSEHTPTLESDTFSVHDTDTDSDRSSRHLAHTVDIDCTHSRQLSPSPVVHLHTEHFEHTENIANTDNRTLKELSAPNVNYQPLCIEYPELDADFELKSGLIHLLPKFHGLAGEDPHKHLKKFHVVYNTMKPHGIDEDHIKLRAFPFSLDGNAKDWLYYLQQQLLEVGMT